MKDPIIRTSQLSMETTEALYKTIKEREGTETLELHFWKRRKDAELNPPALSDMRSQRNALRRTRDRLARRLRLANIPV